MNMKSVLSFGVMAAYVLGMGVLLTPSSHAGTLQGNQRYCTHFANVAVKWAGDVRDAGVSWEEASKGLEESIAEAIGQPGSIIQDKEDAQYVRTQIKKIWNEYRKVAPIDVGVEMIVDCMKKRN